LSFVLDFIIQLCFYGKWMTIIAGDSKYGIHFLFLLSCERGS
jgi:hypothetical protein